jgi:type VI secretion system protein ImpK
MTGASPFDNDHTQIHRPNPGGRSFGPGFAGIDPAGAARQPEPGIGAGGTFAIDPGPPPNDLAEAAIPILLTVSRCRTPTATVPVDMLRDGLMAAMRDYDTTMRNLQVPADKAGISHYLLCETVDEMLQNTPWGQTANWDHSGLVAIFHAQARGGSHFYELLKKLLAAPRANVDVLTLAYYCLSLGFRGRTRLDTEGGREQADKKRREVLDSIRPHLKLPEPVLSPRWRGVPAPQPDTGRRFPALAVAIALLTAPVMAFVLFAVTLAGRSDTAGELLTAVRPAQQRVQLRPPPPPPAPPEQLAVGQRLRTFLQPEIDANKVRVEELGDRIIIRLVGKAQFPSASADISPEYRTIIDRVALALREESGSVGVEGHTDSGAIRSLRYPSNWELSEARARTVAGLLRPVLGPQRPVSIAGYSDTRPLPSSPDGDDSNNRRVEIILMKDNV